LKEIFTGFGCFDLTKLLHNPYQYHFDTVKPTFL